MTEIYGNLNQALGKRNIVFSFPLYLMISGNYQNNLGHEGRRPSFVLFSNKTLYIHPLSFRLIFSHKSILFYNSKKSELQVQKAKDD